MPLALALSPLAVLPPEYTEATPDWAWAMDEAPIRLIEKKNDATKRMRVRFTIMASFISGECRHLRETHGNIKAVPPGSRMHPSVHRLSVMGGKADIAWTCRHVCL